MISLFGLQIDTKAARAEKSKEQFDELELRLKRVIQLEKVLAAARCLGNKITIGADLVGGTEYMDIDPGFETISWGTDPHDRWVVYIPCTFTQDDGKTYHDVTVAVFQRYTNSKVQCSICKAPSTKTSIAGLDNTYKGALDDVFALLRDGTFTESYVCGEHTYVTTLKVRCHPRIMCQ